MKMSFDEDGLLQEPCLSCDKAYVEDIWCGWCCEMKKNVHVRKKESED